MKPVAGILIGLMVWFSTGYLAVAQSAWTCGGTPVEPCVKRHGRLSTQNGIPLKIWLVGTTRMLAISNASVPPVIEKYLEMTSDNHSYIFGDFEICSLGPDVPGHIRSACVTGADKLVVQPLRRREPPFRLLSTWPAGAPRLDPRIPAPITSKYKNILDGTDWLNPSMVIRAEGIEVVSRGLPGGRKTVPTTALLDLIASLPLADWPYGRVVMASDIHLRRADRSDDESIRRNHDAADRILKDLDITVDWWPA